MATAAAARARQDERQRQRRRSSSGGAATTSSGLATSAALASGLLASSCCVLQLALNALSIGCAGFSALTPYRPLFRALTAASLAALACRQGLADRRTLATAAAALALAASSDVLAAVNRGPGLASSPAAPSSPLLPLLLPPLVAAPLRRALAPFLPPGHAVRALLDAACAPPPPSPSSPAAESEGEPRRVALRVKGIRCEACAARVKGALAAVSGVRNASVDADRGEAVVYYYDDDDDGDEAGRRRRRGEDDARAVVRLVAAVEGLKAGYEAEEARARGEEEAAAAAAAAAAG